MFHGDGGSDDTLSISFRDLLFILVICLFAMFVIAVLMPTGKKNDGVELKAELLVIVSWDDGTNDDVDTHCEDPLGNTVWFRTPNDGFMHLDRDDTGNANVDAIKGPDGKQVFIPINEEIVSVRKLIKGEYVCNAHYYRSDDRREPIVNPVTVKVRVEHLNPKVRRVAYSEVKLDQVGQEKTLVRFGYDPVSEAVTHTGSMFKRIATKHAAPTP